MVVIVTLPSEPSPNHKEDGKSINPLANCPLAFNIAILFSSPAPELVFTKLALAGSSLAPVLPVAEAVPCSATVASSNFPATVVLPSACVLPAATALHAQPIYWFSSPVVVLYTTAPLAVPVKASL